MSTRHFLTIALLLASAVSAFAQNAPNAATGVLTPPPDISTIVSIDAHNALIIGTRDPQTPNAPEEFSLRTPRHVYAGGITRLFGGSIMPTEMFVIPESAFLSGAAGQRSGGQGSLGQNSLGQGFGGGSFGGQGFGAQSQSFGNQNYGGQNFRQNNSNFNRGYNSYASRVPVQNLSQFNQLYNYFDRPMAQAQIGVSQ